MLVQRDAFLSRIGQVTTPLPETETDGLRSMDDGLDLVQNKVMRHSPPAAKGDDQTTHLVSEVMDRLERDAVVDAVLGKTEVSRG